MSLSNREIQLCTTCQLYIYVLESQDKEIPEYLQECAQYDGTEEYECLVDCLAELAQEVKNFDDETFERIVNNKDSQEARNLSQWWEMYKMYIPLDDLLTKK